MSQSPTLKEMNHKKFFCAWKVVMPMKGKTNAVTMETKTALERENEA